ncbi:hypothetical protein AcetOrient_orf02885 [Acetobacter orientalis]|uniref:Phage tail protein n=1 Tax=Acetobacter orientalis TaxID=146474 RepID=A0A2Z5ZIT2_9PROT|nr:hypothetical protein AcetOrient_orf02885 [Acetobacter orientalis]
MSINDAGLASASIGGIQQNVIAGSIKITQPGKNRERIATMQGLSPYAKVTYTFGKLSLTVQWVPGTSVTDLLSETDFTVELTTMDGRTFTFLECSFDKPYDVSIDEAQSELELTFNQLIES